MWCWRRLVRVLWTARRSEQSILKEISPEYSLEGLMLKLKLQYLGHLMRRANSLKEILMVGKIEGSRRRGRQRTRWWMTSLTVWTWVWASYGRWWRTGKTGMLQSMESQRIRHDWVTAQIDFSHGKTITLTIWTFVGKAMSLLFNMLPRFVIAFLPSSKHLLISWLQSLSMVILEPKKIKSVTSYFPFIS